MTGTVSTTVLLIAALLASPLIVGYCRRWHLALYGLVLYIPISGYIGVRLGRNPIAVQAKDFFFIIPAYMGFIYTLKAKIRFSGIPKIFTVLISSFCALVLLQILNPHPRNPGFFGGLVGLKVWLFYIPLTMLLYVMISNQNRFIPLIRLM